MLKKLPKQTTTNNSNSKLSLPSLQTPSETHLESTPRPTFPATFADATNTLMLIPGHSNVNSIISKWLHPIHDHDLIVATVEDLEVECRVMARAFNADCKTCRNWEAANYAMTEGNDLDRYIEIKSKKHLKLSGDLLTDIDRYIKYYEVLEDPKAKVAAQDEWNEYITLNPKSERLITMNAKTLEIKTLKQQSFLALKTTEANLQTQREKEKALSRKITSDHVLSSSLNVSTASLFPTIRLNFCLTKINTIPVENLAYTEISNILIVASTPQTLEFRRYDYRMDACTGEWSSLSQMRALNKFVVDPRVASNDFIKSVRGSDMKAIEFALVSGIDVNSIEINTGRNGLHIAACNSNIETALYLLKNGCSVESRDKNNCTPLLLASMRMDLKMVTMLVEVGNARVRAVDENGRSSLIYAIINDNNNDESNEFNLFKYLMDHMQDINTVDTQWGWSTLHFAAFYGNVKLCALIIDNNGDVYKLGKFNQESVLDIAMKSAHASLVYFLTEYIFNEPAQSVLPCDSGGEGGVWVGSEVSVHPLWFTGRDFGGVFGIWNGSKRSKKTHWLEDFDLDPNSSIWYHKVELNASECLKSARTKGSEDWAILLTFLKAGLEFIDICVKANRSVLIFDDLGVNMSIGFVIIWFVTRKSIRVDEAMKIVKSARRDCKLSKGMERGLKGFQEQMDFRRLERLELKLKKAEIVSIAF